ncbi:ribonuclease H1-like [Asterias rubens]|uniref:ribonuclease H1-like n=1 Tax=Asterias rubens TaxID=7604 RepID=UPI0014557768|nr:ribonuclease H1-like [Asterias rubens]
MSTSRFCRALGIYSHNMPKFGHYAVRSGRNVGVFESWDECKSNVDGFQGARYKKFGTAQEAWDFVNASDDPNPYFQKGHQSQGGKYHKNYSAPSSSNYSKKSVAASYAPASIGYEPQQIKYIPQSSYSTKRKHDLEPEYASSSFTYQSKKIRSSSTCSSSSSSRSSSSSSPPLGIGRAVVYTDGSCESNGRRGARAGVGVYWGDNHHYNTSERLEGRQTNQRAEITAAIRALETAKARDIKELTLYTDSKYTMKSITEWMHRWKHNGWKTAGNKDVQNKEDLKTLDGLCQQVNVDWKYVPGHANIKGNEAADSLARAGARMESTR